MWEETERKEDQERAKREVTRVPAATWEASELGFFALTLPALYTLFLMLGFGIFVCVCVCVCVCVGNLPESFLSSLIMKGALSRPNLAFG